MPTGDQDQPPHSRAEQIRKRDFSTVRRGYHPDEVRAYLVSIADLVAAMAEELRLSRESQQAAAAAATPTPDDPYEALSRRFATLIEKADQEATRTIEEARSQATRELEDARKEAHRITVDSQAHAEVTRHEVADLMERAMTEADRILSRAAARRKSLVMQLEEMHGKLIAVAEDLVVPVDEAGLDDLDDDELAKRRDQRQTPRQLTGTAPDPRTEELWGQKDVPIELPDLASLDLDIDERDE